MTETQWLNDTEQCAWRALLQVQAQLNARLARQLQAESDLSLADFEVLVALTDVPEERLRVLELAKTVQWEKSRLSHHLGRMQRRGLIDRNECPADKRGAFIVLTTAGRAAIEAAAPGHVRTVRELVFDHLSAAEIQLLSQIYHRLIDAMD